MKSVIPTYLLTSSLCIAAAPLLCHSQTPQKAPPPVQRGNRVYTEADFLYWLAKQEGNNYATTGNAITAPGTTDPNTGLVPGSITAGKVYAPDPTVKPGFRAGIGVDLEHGGWEFFSEYSYLFSKATGSVSSDNLNAGIIPIYSYAPNNSVLSSATYFVSSGATGFVSAANSGWSLLFNNINFELKKNMRLFKTLSLRPHFGIQTSWQEQKFHAAYIVASTTAFSDILGQNKVIVDQGFWGVGIRLGLDGSWRFIDHLGLYTNSAISTLWGRFDTRARSYDTNSAESYSDLLIGDTDNHFYTISPVLQAEIGVQSDWMFYDKYRFFVQVGWEEQVWFLQAQYSTTIADTSLILQGLTARFRFDF